MSWLWGNDEELAKKDDDHNVPRLGRRPDQWTAARAPRRRLVFRFVVYACILFILFMSFSSLLNTGSRAAVDRPKSTGYVSVDSPPHEAPPANGDGGDRATPVEEMKVYKGPVKLPHLGESLHAIGGTQGKQDKNRNVLFATASLKSAATLLPIACEMALQRLNYVHFAFIGRSDIPLNELLKINSINSECKIIMHGMLTP